ncbi:Ubiquitin carboxyl-terminal hydrolase 40, partial [Stegodyphus mimosarum]
MFGSLFDDERPVGAMTNVHTLAIPRPPSRRLSCGLSGIENQGATCYLNSLLQTLLYT